MVKLVADKMDMPGMPILYKNTYIETLSFMKVNKCLIQIKQTFILGNT